MNEQASVRVTDFIKIEEYCGKDTTEVLTDQYEELYKEKIQANQDVVTAQEKYNEALKKCSEALKECSEALEKYSEALEKYYEIQKIMTKPRKIIAKFYQDPIKLSVNLVEQKFIKNIHTFIVEVC